MPAKSAPPRYDPPAAPFKETPLAGGADRAWQSQATGNTIAFNSECSSTDEDRSLKLLQKKILSGIDGLSIQREERVEFDGREGQRLTGTGTVDGVPVRLSLLTYKKDSCAYDLIYIGRSEAFDQEAPRFESFLKGYRAP